MSMVYLLMYANAMKIIKKVNLFLAPLSNNAMPMDTTILWILQLQAVKFFSLTVPFILSKQNLNERDSFMIPSFARMPLIRASNLGTTLLFSHVMDHRFYVHPLYCFCKDHGGNWGFTTGSGPDDDLPAHFCNLSSKHDPTIVPFASKV